MYFTIYWLYSITVFNIKSCHLHKKSDLINYSSSVSSFRGKYGFIKQMAEARNNDNCVSDGIFLTSFLDRCWWIQKLPDLGMLWSHSRWCMLQSFGFQCFVCGFPQSLGKDKTHTLFYGMFFHKLGCTCSGFFLHLVCNDCK